MGASESHIKEDYWRNEARRRMTNNNKNQISKTKGHSKGKPFSPPDKPAASEITHNSLVLTWNPPKHDGSVLAYTVEMCHMSDNHWLVLTYSCQGCQYQVRNLRPNQIYKFRTRVENVFGTSKPSMESDPVQTNSSAIDISYTNSEKRSKPIRRRHSFNVPLEGTVANILNHSDTVVKSSTCLKNFTTGTHSADSTFQRNCFRTSLDPCRKRSLTSLLPGTKTDSISRMRDSYRKSNQTRASLFTMQGVNRSINNSRSDISGSAYNSKSDISVTPANSKSDVSTVEMTMDKRYSHTSDSQTSSSGIDEMDHGSVDEPEEVWQKKDAVILKASLSDEIKLALCSKIVPLDNSYDYNDKISFEKLANEDKDNIDFRTIRHMLHSSDIIVKPEYIDYNSNGTHFNHKLSTISDVEEEEFVKVTTI